jgi:hypothetical protein
VTRDTGARALIVFVAILVTIGFFRIVRKGDRTAEHQSNSDYPAQNTHR